VKRTLQAKDDLILALHYARNAMTSERAVPARLLKQLALSIEKTSSLLADAMAYNSTIGRLVHKVGAGIVDVSPLQISETLKVAPLDPIEGTALIRLQKLLNAWHRAIEHGPKMKPEKQKAEDEAAIVRVAVEFCSRHSRRKPSTDPNNPVSAFAREFYEHVTGTKPKSSLEHQFRQALESAKSSSGTPRSARRRRTGEKSLKKGG
jgi:hypothetical protein